MANRLSPKKKQLLKEFVDFKCEECHKKKDEKELQIHRKFRGYCGGEYSLNNVKVICFDCHNKFHYKEFQ